MLAQWLRDEQVVTYLSSATYKVFQSCIGYQEKTEKNNGLKS